MPRCRCNTFFAVLCLIPFALPAFAQTSASPSQWNSMVDDFLDQELFPNNPTLATQLGVHDFDAKLEDFSRNGIERHIAGLKKFEARTVALDPKGLSQMETADREMLLSAIRSELLSLQVIRTWEKDPDTYSTGADRKSTRLNSSHQIISYAVFCLKKKKPVPSSRTDRSKHRAYARILSIRWPSHRRAIRSHLPNLSQQATRPEYRPCDVLRSALTP